MNADERRIWWQRPAVQWALATVLLWTLVTPLTLVFAWVLLRPATPLLAWALGVDKGLKPLAIGWGAGGAVAAVGQWLLLRRWRATRAWWILATALVALLAGLALSAFYNACTQPVLCHGAQVTEHCQDYPASWPLLRDCPRPVTVDFDVDSSLIRRFGHSPSRPLRSLLPALIFSSSSHPFVA